MTQASSSNIVESVGLIVRMRLRVTGICANQIIRDNQNMKHPLIPTSPSLWKHYCSECDQTWIAEKHVAAHLHDPSVEYPVRSNSKFMYRKVMTYGVKL